jgi:uncharacterized membrane protein
VIFAAIQYIEGNIWGAAMMSIAGVFTLPLVHRFYNELRTGDRFEDERISRISHKSGFIAFIAMLVAAILTGSIGVVFRDGNHIYADFITKYDTALVGFIGGFVFISAQVFYNRFGYQTSLKEILLGDEK